MNTSLHVKCLNFVGKVQVDMYSLYVPTPTKFKSHLGTFLIFVPDFNVIIVHIIYIFTHVYFIMKVRCVMVNCDQNTPFSFTAFLFCHSLCNILNY